MIENPMVRYQPDTPSIPEWKWKARHEMKLSEVSMDDVLEEICDCEATFIAAVRKGDSELVGRIVMAAVNAYVNRLTDIHFGLSTKAVYAQEAAAKEVLEWHEARMMELEETK